ncbi:MAG: TPM domain-containing protein [Alphaproteobacteria bacterium]|nr:TPM domain-containing protein [Alphaproteobacteria bacterium]
MTFKVTDDMRREIRQAVEALERTTTGEMVCVVAQSSARYVLFPLVWASMAALLLPVVNIAAAGAVTFGIQSIAFIALAALFLLTPLKVAVTPRGLRQTNCRRHAFEQFFALKMNETNKRSGVMLFISVAERHVEIIADKGINDKVLPDEWARIVDAVVTDVRANKVQDAFLNAIRACGAVLVEHFPETRNDVNELDDNLVELPAAKFLS